MEREITPSIGQWHSTVTLTLIVIVTATVIVIDIVTVAMRMRMSESVSMAVIHILWLVLAVSIHHAVCSSIAQWSPIPIRSVVVLSVVIIPWHRSSSIHSPSLILSVMMMARVRRLSVIIFQFQLLHRLILHSAHIHGSHLYAVRILLHFRPCRQSTPPPIPSIVPTVSLSTVSMSISIPSTLGNILRVRLWCNGIVPWHRIPVIAVTVCTVMLLSSRCTVPLIALQSISIAIPSSFVGVPIRSIRRKVHCDPGMVVLEEMHNLPGVLTAFHPDIARVVGVDNDIVDVAVH